MPDTLTSHSYEAIYIGQTAEYAKAVTEQDIQLFAVASGDVNPVHLDADFAAKTPFGEPIAHGMLTGALISAALALELPGPGTVYLSQTLEFLRPVKPGDTVTVQLEVTAKHDRKRIITLDCVAVNHAGKTVAKGVAEVMAPATSGTLPCPALPQVTVS